MDFSATVTAVGLLIAAAVADYKAFTEELFKKGSAKVYTVLGAAFTALFAFYADKIVVK